MIEKRSMSEKILPKASLRRLTDASAMNTYHNLVRLPKIDVKLVVNNIVDVKNEIDNKTAFEHKEIIVNENAKRDGFHMPIIKKAVSTLNLNSIHSNKKLIQDLGEPRNPKFEICEETKMKNFIVQHEVLNSPNSKKLGNCNRDVINKLEQYLNKENLPHAVNTIRNCDNTPLIKNGLKESFRLNQESNRKPKRNIISFDPLKKLDSKSRNTTKENYNTLKLPDEIPKEDYIELFIENMLLKEKFKDIQSSKKSDYDNDAKVFKNRNTVNQPSSFKPKHNSDFIKQNAADPWFMVQQNFEPDEDISQTLNMVKLPETKANCCINYINNNFHLNFVSPMKKGKRNTVNPFLKNQNQQNGWNEKLVEFLHRNQINDSVKKPKNPNNMGYRFPAKMTNNHYANNEPQIPQNNQPLIKEKGFKLKPSPYTQNTARKSVNKYLVSNHKYFHEDSTTLKESSETTDHEKNNSSTPPTKIFGVNGKYDAFNFTFSNFKDQNK